MVTGYLQAEPDPALLDFLQHDFKSLSTLYGGVVGTAFKNYPSFPQRYIEAVSMPVTDPLVRIERVKPPSQPTRYTEDDLHIRHFTDSSARRVTSKGRFLAA